MSEEKVYPVGWQCPRCGSVNAPQKERCKCVKTEDKDKEGKELLAE
jgi:ribosomal protein S27AE